MNNCHMLLVPLTPPTLVALSSSQSSAPQMMTYYGILVVDYPREGIRVLLHHVHACNHHRIIRAATPLLA